MKVILNPGTFSCEDANEKNAEENIKQFIKDCKLSGLYYRRCKERDYNEDDEDDRFCFLILRDGYDRVFEIQMPGWELKKVRWMSKEESGSIWDFPRLYKDDSSWIWKIALLDEEDYSKD